MAVFDQEANTYDGWYGTKLGAFVDQIETKCAFNLLNVHEGMTILDVGCGTGNFSIKLAKMGCKVIGVDVSEDMLDLAREKAKVEGVDITFKKMDVYNMTFGDDSFDGVLSMAAFEFIKEPKKAMEEIFRIVKPGGDVLVGTINRESQWGKLYMSEEMQKYSVFKFADFKILEDMASWKPNDLLKTSECLFISPHSPEGEITLTNEKELSEKERGGFICALWKK